MASIPILHMGQPQIYRSLSTSTAATSDDEDDLDFSLHIPDFLRNRLFTKPVYTENLAVDYVDESEPLIKTKKNNIQLKISPFILFFGMGMYISMFVYDSFLNNPNWNTAIGKVVNPLFGPGLSTLERFGMDSNLVFFCNLFFFPHVPSLVFFLLNIPFLAELEAQCEPKLLLTFVSLSMTCNSIGLLIRIPKGAGGGLYPIMIFSFFVRKKPK